MTNLRLTRYYKYTDSNIEWLGEIPAHWSITRNKDIFEERGSLSSTGDETLLTVSHITGVTRRSEKNVNMFMAETMEGYKHCSKGDLVINTMWAWMGALGTANENGICSPAYGVYKPRKCQPYNHRYFDYLYRTPNAITEMTKNSKGIVSSRLRLYPKDFFQIKTALPPAIEQKAIADYIDVKTTQIDSKIKLLEKKAGLYFTLRLAIIDNAVLQGLNKNTKTKLCDINGINNIPLHWRTVRLKEIGYLYSGLTGKKGDDFTDEHEDSSPFVPFTNVANNFLLSVNELKSVVVHKSEVQNFIRKNDLFFLMSSEDYADLGKCSLLNSDINTKTYLNSFCKGFRVTKDFVNPFFLAYLLHSSVYRTNLSNEGKGFTRINLKMEKIKDINLLIPELSEQEMIVNFLNEKTGKTDRLIEVLNNQISKLKELRLSIINDAVTGKIRVNYDDKNKGVAA